MAGQQHPGPRSIERQPDATSQPALGQASIDARHDTTRSSVGADAAAAGASLIRPAQPTTVSANGTHTYAEAEAILRRSPSGGRLLDAMLASGKPIHVTTDTEFADYTGAEIRINPKVLDDPTLAAGVLAHEMGHWALDDGGRVKRLNDLPHNLGTLANEVAAESLASAIAREGGFARGPSSVTRDDGGLRSIEGGFDEILKSDFYINYYKIDLASLTPADRAAAYATVRDEGLGLLARFGTPVPAEYQTTDIGSANTPVEPPQFPVPSPETVPAPAQPAGHSELAFGSTGDEVRQLQHQLNALIGAGLDEDGIFGDHTRAAVESLQRFFQLDVDGIVGPQTWGMIDFLTSSIGIPV